MKHCYMVQLPFLSFNIHYNLWSLLFPSGMRTQSETRSILLNYPSSEIMCRSCRRTYFPWFTEPIKYLQRVFFVASFYHVLIVTDPTRLDQTTEDRKQTGHQVSLSSAAFQAAHARLKTYVSKLSNLLSMIYRTNRECLHYGFLSHLLSRSNNRPNAICRKQTGHLLPTLGWKLTVSRFEKLVRPHPFRLLRPSYIWFEI